MLIKMLSDRTTISSSLSVPLTESKCVNKFKKMTSLWNALPYFSAEDEIMIMVMIAVTRSCIASIAGEGSGGRQG